MALVPKHDKCAGYFNVESIISECIDQGEDPYAEGPVATNVRPRAFSEAASGSPREQLRHAHAAALTPALTGGCHGDDLLKSLYKSLYKNAKDPTLSILGHHGGRRKVASLRPPFSTPATPRDKPEPAGPFPPSIERAPPLFVHIPAG